MSNNDLITTGQVVKLLGVPLTTFNGGKRCLVGFPRPAGKIGKQALYSRAEVRRWAKGKNVNKLVSEAQRKRRDQIAASQANKLEKFNTAAKNFLSGGCLSKAQKNRLNMKKLVARVAQPKTTRVHLEPDWMRD